MAVQLDCILQQVHQCFRMMASSEETLL